MEKVTRVYKVTNLLDDRAYIGATTRTLEARWASHLKSSKNTHAGYALHAAIRKNGVQNFRIELLEICPTRRQGLKREGEFVALFGTGYPMGYNKMYQGGKRGPESAATRSKKSVSHTGSTWSPLQRERITAAQKTPEYREKMRQASRKVKRGPLSEATKEKIRRKTKENWKDPAYRAKFEAGMQQWRQARAGG